MRIIAGEHRGRRLLGPADASTTRPITDRVKTSLFDSLEAAGRLARAVVLDLFAGTGSMGIECLSRGAKHVTFVERDRVAQERLKKNLAAIGAGPEANLIVGDATSAAILPALGEPVTLIFVDPPYAMMSNDKRARPVVKQMRRLADSAAERAVMVLRTDKRTPAPTIEGWAGPTHKTHGSMTLHFYERPGRDDREAMRSLRG